MWLILEYRSAGLDLDEHKILIQNQVPAQLVQKYTSAGLKVKDHELSLLQRLEPAKAIEATK